MEEGGGGGAGSLSSVWRANIRAGLDGGSFEEEEVGAEARPDMWGWEGRG